jgi:plastocyanin
MRPTRAIGLFALLAAAGSCGGGGEGGTVTDPGPGPNNVDVRDNSFSPSAMSVPVGTTVTWTWRGSNAHDVYFSSSVNSGAKTSGSYARQFTAAGSYDYLCTIHGSAMSGQVVVQ